MARAIAASCSSLLSFLFVFSVDLISTEPSLALSDINSKCKFPLRFVQFIVSMSLIYWSWVIDGRVRYHHISQNGANILVRMREGVDNNIEREWVNCESLPDIIAFLFVTCGLKYQRLLYPCQPIATRYKKKPRRTHTSWVADKVLHRRSTLSIRRGRRVN